MASIFSNKGLVSLFQLGGKIPLAMRLNKIFCCLAFSILQCLRLNTCELCSKLNADICLLASKNQDCCLPPVFAAVASVALDLAHTLPSCTLGNDRCALYFYRWNELYSMLFLLTQLSFRSTFLVYLIFPCGAWFLSTVIFLP